MLSSTPPPNTPPWPQVVPVAGLPPFPGRGWEFDEPPSPAVQQRAGQLVSQLWARGSGAYRIEQTAGRWTAYRAEVVRSGKRGVVAYRVRSARPVPTVPAAVPAPSMPPVVPSVPPLQVEPAAAPIPSPPSSSSAVRVLRQGLGMPPQAPQADVRALQVRLGVPADGRFGPGTKAAVQAFQRSKGLLADGIVGPQTRLMLDLVRA